MAAAWELAAGGASVEVYEARPVAGGRMRTEGVGGVKADAVIQLLSDGYTVTRALLDDLGLSERLVAVPGRDAVWRGGRAHALRYGSVGSMVASGAIPAGLKMRLGLRYLPFLERHRDVLDLNDPGRAAEAGLDGESIADWGRRELGEAFVELMAYPLLAASRPRRRARRSFIRWPGPGFTSRCWVPGAASAISPVPWPSAWKAGVWRSATAPP